LKVGALLSNLALGLISLFTFLRKMLQLFDKIVLSFAVSKMSTILEQNAWQIEKPSKGKAKRAKRINGLYVK